MSYILHTSYSCSASLEVFWQYHFWHSPENNPFGYDNNKKTQVIKTFMTFFLCALTFAHTHRSPQAKIETSNRFRSRFSYCDYYYSEIFSAGDAFAIAFAFASIGSRSLLLIHANVWIVFNLKCGWLDGAATNNRINMNSQGNTHNYSDGCIYICFGGSNSTNALVLRLIRIAFSSACSGLPLHFPSNVNRNGGAQVVI